MNYPKLTGATQRHLHTEPGARLTTLTQLQHHHRQLWHSLRSLPKGRCLELDKMRSHPLLGLPSSLLLLTAACITAEHPGLIRKMSPNAGEKLLPNDLAFTPNDVFGTINTTPLSPREELLAARMADDNFLSNTSFSYRPPFAEHHDSTTSIGWESLRRAVEALHILEKRQSCPTTMNSCEYIGAANKCCLSNEVCVKVVDEHVGNVACCPKGAACSGAVAACPSGTTSCDAEMSGGCCIPGYVCQGVGCKYSHTLPYLAIS